MGPKLRKSGAKSPHSCHSERSEESAVELDLESVAPSLSRSLRQDGPFPTDGASCPAGAPSKLAWAGILKSSPLPTTLRPATSLRHAHPPKRRGEMAELAFMRKAIGLGFGVAKPWGDSDRYDFILDSGRRLWRVQVRSTEYQSHRGYAVHTYVYVKKAMVPLTAREVDAIVAYIVPLDLWYVVPIQFADCKNLWFYPHGSKKGSRFERFREAWSLLK
jgi:hypothetical protein